MRNLLIVPLLLISSLSLFGQSADQGRLKINLGAGVGILQTYNNYGINNSPLAVPNLGVFEVEYNTRNRLSVGLEVFSHSYETEDTSIISIEGGAIGLDLKYFFMNKEKSNAFIGTTVGGIAIIYNAFDYPDSSAVDQTKSEIRLEASGIYNKVYIGYNKYFGNVIGLYIKAGILNTPFRLNSLTIDNIEVDRIYKKPASEWKSLFRGGFIEVGLTIKLRNNAKAKA